MYLGNLHCFVDLKMWGLGITLYLPSEMMEDYTSISIDFFCFHFCYTYVYEQKPLS